MVGLIILSSSSWGVVGVSDPSWIEYYDVGTLSRIPNPAIRANHARHEADLLVEERARHVDFGDGGVDQSIFEILLHLKDRIQLMGLFFHLRAPNGAAGRRL